MNMHVRRWGNSAAIRLPGSVMTAAGLKIDDAVTITEEQGRLVIEAITPAKVTLEWLIAGITPDTVHEEVEFGPPQGSEAW